MQSKPYTLPEGSFSRTYSGRDGIVRAVDYRTPAQSVALLRSDAANVWQRIHCQLVISAVLVMALCGGTLRAWAAPAATSSTLEITSSGGSTVITVASGSVVTLTAVVQAGASAVTVGQVKFCDASATYCADIHLLGTKQLTRAGTAVLKFVPGIGSHNYRAIFLGTTSYATSSSSDAYLTATATAKYSTTTTIAQSGNAGSYLLAATLVGTGGLVSPTGAVSFLDASNGNAVLGTAMLGTGTTGLDFLNSSNPTTGVEPVSVAVGDFNGDGFPDLAVANYGSNTVTILLGNGNGTFTQAVYSPVTVGNGPVSVVVGDFNGDGIPDLAVANQASNTVTILLGNGNGTFTQATYSPVTVDYNPVSLVVGDFNGDGIEDLAVVNNVSLVYSGSTVTVLLGNGNGIFTKAVNSPVATGFSPTSISVGDFNGDGILDIAMVNADLVVVNGSPIVCILLGNGNGTFTQAVYSQATTVSPSSITVGDFNGDGILDLAVVSDVSYGTMAILLGNGNGSFTQAPVSVATVGLNPISVAVGDFNGDGIPDIAVANDYYDGTVTILLGNGNGTFTQAPNSPVSLFLAPQSLAVGNFNGDGISDLAVAFFASNNANADGTMAVQLSQLAHQVEAVGQSISPVGTGTHQVEASYPGDSNYASSVSTATGLTAQPGITTLMLSANPTSSTFGQQVVLTATLSPYSGSNGESVTFYSGTTSIGVGTLASGVATLNTTSLALATSSLKAVYGGDTNLSASTSNTLSFKVSPTAPTITFTVPNHTYGDAPFAVSATSNSSGAITYSVVSGPATISGSTVTLSGAGTVVLLASQAAAGSYAAGTQTATFTVAGQVPSITFTVPNHTYGDAPFTVLATSNSTGAVTYSVVSGPATISGSTVTLTSAGSVVLQASQVAAGNYTAGTQTATVTIAKESQTITFNAPASSVNYGVAPITLSASASSGLALAFNVVSGPGTISGSTLTITGAGTVVVAANQAGNSNYAVSTQVTQSIVVNQASQTITFTAPTSPVTYGVSPITLVATGGASGNAVVYSVVSGPGSVSGSTLTITGAGMVVVAANQVGNANYAAATQVTQSIVVNVIGVAATPTFLPVAGTYTAAQTVTISDAKSGATIYYTTNGTTPTTSSSVYSGAIPVSSTETIEAVATAPGYSTSAVASAAYTIANPAPAISGLSPAFTNAGGAVLPLTVNGSGFIATSTVYWGTSALTTTYVSATQLTAQVPAADIATAGTISITVQTPAPGGGTSNAWQFEVDSVSSGATAPTITSTTETVTAGSTASYPVTMPSAVTSVSVTCLNLPTGAACSYSSTTNTVTITTSSTTPKGTYQITVVFIETVSGAASGFILLPILLLPLGFMRRKLAARGILLTACLGLVLMATAALSIGCGSGGSSGSGSTIPPATHQVTSSGAVSLTIQ